MAKDRSDMWYPRHDDLLSDTVLHHIMTGSTQIKAFEEVGTILDRSPAACGFRWNAVLRGDYKDALRVAHRLRRERKGSDVYKPKTHYLEASHSGNRFHIHVNRKEYKAIIDALKGDNWSVDLSRLIEDMEEQL